MNNLITRFLTPIINKIMEDKIERVLTEKIKSKYQKCQFLSSCEMEQRIQEALLQALKTPLVKKEVIKDLEVKTASGTASITFRDEK